MILDITSSAGAEQIQNIRKIEILPAVTHVWPHSITVYFYDGGSVTFTLDGKSVTVTND